MLGTSTIIAMGSLAAIIGIKFCRRYWYGIANVNKNEYKEMNKND